MLVSLTFADGLALIGLDRAPPSAMPSMTRCWPIWRRGSRRRKPTPAPSWCSATGHAFRPGWTWRNTRHARPKRYFGIRAAGTACSVACARAACRRWRRSTAPVSAAGWSWPPPATSAWRAPDAFFALPEGTPRHLRRRRRQRARGPADRRRPHGRHDADRPRRWMPHAAERCGLVTYIAEDALAKAKRWRRRRRRRHL